MAKNKDKKKPKASVLPAGGKHPVAAIDPDATASYERVSWRFSILDFDGGPWSWNTLTIAKAEEVMEKLANHETLTLKAFFAKSGTNKIPLASVCKEAQERAEALQLDDAEDLFEIRLMGAERVWGTMTGGVFNLLWWDPDHTVYPVAKKHT